MDYLPTTVFQLIDRASYILTGIGMAYLYVAWSMKRDTFDKKQEINSFWKAGWILFIIGLIL